jgi:uncharacterized spore protein YtfJ
MAQKGFDKLRDALGFRTVFAAPVERDGVTLVPAATIIGGGGFGTNEAGPEGDPPPGTGGGYGGIAWPAGAFEVREDSVTWHPAIDLTWALITALGIAGSILKLLLSRR